MKRLLLLTTFVFFIVRVYGQGTQVGDSNSPIYHYNGNVGIGITNPENKLKILGSGTIGGKWNPGNAYLSITGGNDQLIFDTNEIYAANSLAFGIYNTGNFSFRSVSLTGVTELMTINTGGNVGIGTITPSERLEIFGGGNLLIRGSANDAGDLIFRKSDHSQLGRIWTNSSGASGMYLSSGDNNSDLTIYSNGNVGIGTTTPDYKLDVLGTIRANEVKVATGWSDFVFEPEYDLPSLQELQDYINQNGHLPDIPSAEEVKADGISLGEMDAKLLRKIEELTLYVIEQNKKLEFQSETLKAQNEELREIKKENEDLKNENLMLEKDLMKEIETIKTQLK